MLGALAEGSMEAVVLVGSDPVGDFPDRGLARSALEQAGFVVAVDGFLSRSAALADVVLPVAIAHEKTGTTTNIEGRVTRLAQKLVAPGQSWPDWMVAAELAERMSAGLGVSSAAELWDEIERLAPSHAGITRVALDTPAARDGIVAPLPASPVRIKARGSLAPFDPMATPGIDAVEAQGAPPRAGTAEPPGGDEPVGGLTGAAAGNGEGASRAPRTVRWPVAVDAPAVPAPDRYSMRLVSPRRLYDDGVLLAASASLAPLAGRATVRANPHDLGQLGVGTGASVRVRSSRGEVVLEAVADDGVARGVVSVAFNLHGDGHGNGNGADGSGGASTLIDVGVPVVDVRLETL
jgi:predicted molibdopterin-dependent oxidoreductase YjgC